MMNGKIIFNNDSNDYPTLECMDCAFTMIIPSYSIPPDYCPECGSKNLMEIW